MGRAGRAFTIQVYRLFSMNWGTCVPPRGVPGLHTRNSPRAVPLAGYFAKVFNLGCSLTSGGMSLPEEERSGSSAQLCSSRQLRLELGGSVREVGELAECGMEFVAPPRGSKRTPVTAGSQTPERAPEQWSQDYSRKTTSDGPPGITRPSAERSD